MLIFYDLETTGLSPENDQVLEIAAVETDNECVPTGNVFCQYVRLGVDRIPTPEALLVSNKTIEEFCNRDAPDRIEVLDQFVAWVATRMAEDADLTFLGWNSRRFDDSFLQHELLRALQVPSLVSHQPRHDAMRMAQLAYWVHDEHALRVPRILNKRGKEYPSFRLEAIAAQNGIAHTEAHTARSDVDATVGIGRLLAERVPMEWARQLSFGRRDFTLGWLREHPYFLDLEYAFGRSYPIPASLITDLDESLLMVANLTDDLPPSEKITDKKLPVRYFSLHAPMVCPYDDQRLALDVATVRGRAERLAADRNMRVFLVDRWQRRRAKDQNGPMPRHTGASLLWMRKQDPQDLQDMEAFREQGPRLLDTMTVGRTQSLAARACLEQQWWEPSGIVQKEAEAVRNELLAPANEGDGKIAPLSIQAALERVQKALGADHTYREQVVLEGYQKWLLVRQQDVRDWKLKL